VTDIYLMRLPAGLRHRRPHRAIRSGLMFGAHPMWQTHGISMPRLGIGYRVAGVLSAGVW